MDRWFVPYQGEKPACVTINGHKLVILSPDQSQLEEHLDVFGADRVKEFEVGQSEEESTQVIESLAVSAAGKVVVAPGELDLEEIIKNLELKLPWVQ